MAPLSALRQGVASTSSCGFEQRSNPGHWLLRSSRRQPQPQRPDVRCRGILDSYRRERGLPTAGDAAGGSNGTAGGGLTATAAPPAEPKTLKQRLAIEEGEQLTEEDIPCPVECVIEINTVEEMNELLNSLPKTTLAVVDFMKTACGACKFIAPGFVKLCKDTASDAPVVVFAKHNVFDDETGKVTPLAKKYNVRNVPKFLFFKAGAVVEEFATRDKERVAAAINRHAGPGTV